MKSNCIIDEDGTKRWYLDANPTRLHREDGPAVESPEGNKYWYRYGYLHRVGGPAVERCDGYKAWYQNDDRHREDGPAILWPDGKTDWFLHGKRINCQSQVEFEKLMKLKAFW